MGYLYDRVISTLIADVRVLPPMYLRDMHIDVRVL